MRSYGWTFVSLVWRGDMRWVHHNLYRAPKFYGLTIGWLAIGIVIWGRRSLVPDKPNLTPETPDRGVHRGSTCVAGRTRTTGPEGEDSQRLSAT